MGSLGTPELLIIAAVLVMLFGARKLPDTARALGRSMRIFKSEAKAMQNDGEQEPAGQPAPQQRPPAELPAPTPTADGTTVNGRPLSETESGKKTN